MNCFVQVETECDAVEIQFDSLYIEFDYPCRDRAFLTSEGSGYDGSLYRKIFQNRRFMSVSILKLK